MMRRMFTAVAAMALAATAVIAQAQYGTAAEAKAMLEKAVAAVKADKAKALADFQAGAGGFKDRDLYVFCAGPDGIITAHPSIKGQQLKTLVDKNGKKLGEEIVANAAEGKIAEVSYMWPRPGADTTPVDKVELRHQDHRSGVRGGVLQVGVVALVMPARNSPRTRYPGPQIAPWVPDIR